VSQFCPRQPFIASLLCSYLGVFVTREHVRHNKSGIAHRGRTGINHLRELPTTFAAVGRLPCPTEPENHRCAFGVRGAEKSGELYYMAGLYYIAGAAVAPSSSRPWCRINMRTCNSSSSKRVCLFWACTCRTHQQQACVSWAPTFLIDTPCMQHGSTCTDCTRVAEVAWSVCTASMHDAACAATLASQQIGPSLLALMACFDTVLKCCA
jgi:hypothetical protein